MLLEIENRKGLTRHCEVICIDGTQEIEYEWETNLLRRLVDFSVSSLLPEVEVI